MSHIVERQVSEVSKTCHGSKLVFPLPPQRAGMFASLYLYLLIKEVSFPWFRPFGPVVSS
jgi:hypothetical protein